MLFLGKLRRIRKKTGRILTVFYFVFVLLLSPDVNRGIIFLFSVLSEIRIHGLFFPHIGFRAMT